MRTQVGPGLWLSARKGYEDRYASVRTNAVRTAVLDSGDYVGPSIS